MQTIAHISDLHFGVSNQDSAMRSLGDYLSKQLKPDLVLVTGDVVDSPSEDLYKKAAEALRSLGTVYVCPGNHDRHVHGNALGGLLNKVVKIFAHATGFDQAFAGMIATPIQPFDISLGSWKIRVIGVDTSRYAKYSAQGIVDNGDVESIFALAQKAIDKDLVILLQHHHLLPIKELEQQQQEAKKLFNPTILLNAGTMLQMLTQSNVNLVLHGHEHQKTVARFGTFHKNQGEVIVVGAGSATGAATLRGCELNRASFNLFELRDDKSIWIRSVEHNGHAWGQQEPRQLMESRSVRRARFYRTSQLPIASRSRLMKCMEFGFNRDILVTETWDNFILPDGEFTKQTVNSTGWLSDALVAAEWGDGHRVERRLGFERSPEVDHTYRLRTVLREGGSPVPAKVTTSFTWYNGAILTTGDQALAPEHKGDLRNQGYEFAAADAVTDLESLSLLVQVPKPFAPKNAAEIIVGLRDNEGRRVEHGGELAQWVHFHAPGIFSLDVPYPMRGYEYSLSWRPVPDEARASPQAIKFREAARAQGEHLLANFGKAAMRGLPAEDITLALYIPTGDDTVLNRVALTGNPTEDTIAPEELPLRGNQGLHSSAWYGEYSKVIFEDGDLDSIYQHGGRSGERAIALIPIENVGPDTDVTWGLIRVGVKKGVGSQQEQANKIVEAFGNDRLASGVLAMLKSVEF